MNSSSNLPFRPARVPSMRTVFLALLSIFLLQLAPAASGQSTAFNYLGQLTLGGRPADGLYDFRFRLFNRPTGGSLIGTPMDVEDVFVQNGVFAVTLDFRVPLPAKTYWIEVAVRKDGEGEYVLLLPLQEVSPYPSAQTADTANTSTYSTTAGTAGYATNANHAETSGYANVSGFAGQAGHANSSTFSTNAGFANTAGFATNAQHANTSTYSTNAGFANQAGHANTATFSTNAAFANEANHANSSTYATNAGHANTATLATSVAPGGVDGAALQPGIVVRSLNTLTDHVVLVPGPNLFITPSNDNTIHLSASAAVSSGGWSFNGDTIGTGDFLGTLNALPLNFRAGNSPVLQLAPDGSVVVDPAGRNIDGAPAPGLTFGDSSGEGISSQRGPALGQRGLDFFTGSQRRMTIANNGGVGIGTNLPQSALHVAGTVTADRFVATAEAPPANVIPVLGMVWLKPGSFFLGSPESDADGAFNEYPQTAVTQTRGFWIGAHEVTQAEYQSLVVGNPSAFTGDENRPVERVNWNAAVNYCQLLTDTERLAGRLPENWNYRLPTEAEWEFACRAGPRTTRFSHGDDRSYAALGNYAWHAANAAGTTHPVEQKLGNPWGLLDMHGNVWEWCQDRFGPYPGGSVTDPQGWPAGSQRVIRGGGWNSSGNTCRSASREPLSQNTVRNDVGFRVVLAPSRP